MGYARLPVPFVQNYRGQILRSDSQVGCRSRQRSPDYGHACVGQHELEKVKQPKRKCGSNNNRLAVPTRHKCEKNDEADTEKEANPDIKAEHEMIRLWYEQTERFFH
jgi:hypothetical protein